MTGKPTGLPRLRISKSSLNGNNVTEADVEISFGPADITTLLAEPGFNSPLLVVSAVIEAVALIPDAEIETPVKTLTSFGTETPSTSFILPLMPGTGTFDWTPRSNDTSFNTVRSEPISYFDQLFRKLSEEKFSRAT